MFWRGVLGYLPVNIVQGLVGFLTIIVFTRMLPPHAFGHYALGLAAHSIVHTALFTWNEAAVARFWARWSVAGDAGANYRAALGSWLRMLAPLALVLALVLLAPVSAELRMALAAGVCAVAPRSLIRLFQERLKAAGEIRAMARLDLIQLVGAFVIGAASALMGMGGASPLIGIGLAAALCVALQARAETALVRGTPASAPRLLPGLSYGAPVSASLLLALALSSGDRILIGIFLDEASVGAYHAGFSISSRMLDILFIWLGSAGGPALVQALERGGAHELDRVARDQASLMLLLGLPATVGLALVARPLAALMVGPDLAAEAARVVPFAAFAGLLAGLTTHYFHQAFTLGRRPGLMLGAMAAPAAASLLLNSLLLPSFGLDGALWSAPISYAIGLGASIMIGRGLVQLPIPWRTLAQATAASLLMAGLVVLLPSSGGPAELFMKAFAGALVYGLAAALLDAGGLRGRLQTRLRTRPEGAAE